MRRFFGVVLSCLVTAAAGGMAEAAEQIRLPYTCGFENGRLVLRPSSVPHVYTVLGEREQKTFTDCSLARGDECRALMIHRFSIACQGQNVPWYKAVAAIRSKTGFRSWIANNRLKIVYPSRNGVRAACLDDTTPREGVRKVSTGCLPWRHADSASAMSIDSEFAPVEDIGGKIITVADTGHMTTGSVLIGAAAEGGWVTTVNARDLSEQASAASFLAIGPKSSWILMFSAMLLMSGGWFAWRKGYGHAVIDAYRTYRGEQILRKGLDDLAAHFSGAAKSSAQDNAGATPGAGASSQSSAPKSMGENLDNAASFVTAVLTDARERVARLGAGALRGVLEQELYVIGQRLNYTRTAAADGRETTDKAAAIFRTLVREVERLRRIAESAEASEAGLRDNAQLPRSRSEAFSVLGVNPDVSEQIVKKLVDALRMSWHPDLGKDDADRVAREERIKQINVAWELINGKRVAA